MKANKFFALAAAALALVACGGNNGGDLEVSKVTLDKATLTLEVGGTAELVATVEPAGAAEVVWSSQDETIAAVANGKVTGVAEGQTLIVAKAGAKSASCIVKVGKGGGGEGDDKFAALLSHDSYYVFALDDNSFASIEKKVVGDYRINGGYDDTGALTEGATSVLQIWDESFVGNKNGAGLNCFGAPEDCISLISAYGKWGSAGYGGIFQVDRVIDLSGVDGDYTLAIAYKCPANNTSAQTKFTLYSTTASREPEVEIVGKGNTGGEWELLETKVSTLKTKGLDWSPVISKEDLNAKAWFTIGLFIDKIDQGLDVDAILLYK